ncbi:MAG TPA: two-component regulator propeller domain-containing protein [Candidatus Acidoferrales bacterium]|nr:two-component regulator propeller domain-containing protein [Candidatus Acidoferrales bacterium]
MAIPFRVSARTLLFLVIACPAPASGRPASAPAPENAVIKLPVIDKRDIPFLPLSVNGESLQTRIWSIAQDRYGVLWIGTSDGLFRYDAYRLRRYRNERDPSRSSLASDPIRFLCTDRAGILWVGTTNEGLYRLDPATEILTHFRHDPRNSGSLSDDGTLSALQDHGGTLWIGTQAGLDRLDPATGTFIHYPDTPPDPGTPPHPGVLCIFEDRAGNLWTGTGEGLKKLDRATRGFSHFVHDPKDAHGLGHNYITSIVEDQAGDLWLASPFGNGLCAFDVKTGKFRRYSFRAEEAASQSVVGVNRLFLDRSGTLWVCSVDMGLLEFDPDRTRLFRYARNAGDPASLPHDSVAVLFEDAEGEFWAGTGRGLCRFSSKPPRFINYSHEPGNPNTLHDNMIWSVRAGSNGILWIGTEYGLNRLDRQAGRFTLYRHDPNNARSLSYDKVAAIREDPSGALWFATYGGGLDRFDPATGQFFAYRHDPNNPFSLGSDSARSLLMDRHGVLWVGTQNGGLNRFDARTGRFTIYRDAPAYIGTVIEDRAGILWLGSENDGLGRFDPATEHFTYYRHNPRDPRSLSADRVYVITEDRAGTLWAGTQNGLDRLDPGSGTFTTFTTKDGLPGNTISGIFEDARGYLWVATHDGLSRFDPRTKTFRNYTQPDGLPDNLLNPYFAEGGFQTSAGEVILTSSKGLTTFYPDRLADNPHVPPVLLTDFYLFNKPVAPGADSPLHKPVWAAGSLKLTHAQGIFSVEFAALSYIAPEKNRYRYRLEGLEKDWNEVDSRQRLATYTSLPPATYTFRVQASNNDGVWNEKGASLVITVLPPWWGTWLFRCCVAVSIVALAFAAYRYRIRAFERQTAMLEEQVSARTRDLRVAKDAAEAANRAKSAFLANMSHELRTPLNAILGFSSLVRGDPALPQARRNDMDIISRSGEHLLGLIDDVLDMAKIEAGRERLELAPCDLRQIVRETAEMVRVRADQKNIELEVVVSPGFPRFVVTDAGKVRQILLNLLGNAVKFTDRGSVTFRAHADRGNDGDSVKVTLEVEDTGTGIAPEDQQRIFEPFVQVGKPGSQKGTGLGLTITRQFVESMGGSIAVTSAPGQGSRFRIVFPVTAAAETAVKQMESEYGRLFRLPPGPPEWRVLIVEDETENRLLLERLLREAGFAVRAAANGEDGVRVFQNWRPHFIWMDVRMPVMNGLEATRRIRAMDGGRGVKIVAVSASTSQTERDEVMSSGLDDFLLKPYRPAEIFRCMARQLGVVYLSDTAAAAVERQSIVPLTPEALSTLPVELRAQLRQAVISLDPQVLAAVIRRISEVDAGIGGALAARAGRLAYTAILKALTPAD